MYTIQFTKHTEECIIQKSTMRLCECSNIYVHNNECLTTFKIAFETEIPARDIVSALRTTTQSKQMCCAIIFRKLSFAEIDELSQK